MVERATIDPVRSCLQRALNHELPNQLIGLQGMLKLLALEEAAALSSEGREILARATLGVRRCHGLVLALAELVRLETMAVVHERVEVGETFREVGAEVKQVFPNVPLTYHEPIGFASLRVPRRAFGSVLVTLAKHLAGRGVEQIVFAAEQMGWEARISLTVPRNLSMSGTLFEPFVEGETGLELFTAERRAAAWGGRVVVERSPNGGTHFLVTVPITGVDQGRESVT